ncbi:F0F1 ATP synthase subunit A [Chitinophagaceae bacterium MMS25-I14]
MIRKRLFSLIILVFACSFANFSAFANAEEPKKAEDKEKFNASEVIFGHISDSHEWHFFSVGETHATIPLPVILYSPSKGLSVFSSSKFGHEGNREEHEGYKLNEKDNKIEAVDGTPVYDFSITKNVVSMIISVILLLWIMLGVAKKYKQQGSKVAPSGFQNALEPVITFVRDEVAKPNLGNKYMKFMPLLLTVFFFIWINNLLGLLPGGANFTGNIAVTGCLALVSFIVMVINGNKHFWGHLLNPPGVPFGVKIILVPIEIISLFIKPIALMIRLFANILAGHIIILSVVSMIFIFGKMGASPAGGFGFSIVSIAFSVFMFFLELLVAAIQAFIFTNLTAVFIGQATEEHHHEAHEDGFDHAHSDNEIIA